MVMKRLCQSTDGGLSVGLSNGTVFWATVFKGPNVVFIVPFHTLCKC